MNLDKLVDLKIGMFSEYDDNNYFDMTKMSGFGGVLFDEGVRMYEVERTLLDIAQAIENIMPSNSVKLITETEKFEGLTDEQYDQLQEKFGAYGQSLVMALDNCAKKGARPTEVQKYLKEKLKGRIS